jgi:hypothetical protein
MHGACIDSPTMWKRTWEDKLGGKVQLNAGIPWSKSASGAKINCFRWKSYTREVVRKAPRVEPNGERPILAFKSQNQGPGSWVSSPSAAPQAISIDSIQRNDNGNPNKRCLEVHGLWSGLMPNELRIAIAESFHLGSVKDASSIKLPISALVPRSGRNIV